MKKRYLILAAVLIVVGLITYMVVFGFSDSKATQYDFTTVGRGTIENTISASGTLSPVTSVEVGTQISGTVAHVYVDFNDPVQEGQLLAVLDTTVLKSAVLDAESGVERADAQLAQAQSDYDRNKSLLDNKLIADATFLPFDIALRMQKAALKSAQVALQKAKRNMEYAVIESPIKGIVISRNIEAGQTVAASLSTPTLFVIAQDLSHMEILADVDESDIGQIKDGQSVRFEVTAYPGKKFTGVVRQIRLQPQTVSNVVTYTVVVQASNENNLLLPGMTASLEFVIDRKEDVLMISNKALRFTPDSLTVAAAMAKQRTRADEARQSREPGGSDSTASRDPLPGGSDSTASAGSHAGGPPHSADGKSRRPSMVWYVDSTGVLAAAPFRPGITDGTNTEILASRTLTEGMKVIAGQKGQTSTKAPAVAPSGQRPGGFRAPF